MARHAQDREDLLRDAKALVERIELHVPSGDPAAEIFAGFRNNGALSIYFGQDLAYHFNSQGELRRAFSEGRLVKSERGRLVALKTARTTEEVAMLRHEMSPDEQARFCASMLCHLSSFQKLLADRQWTVAGEVPGGGNVVQRLEAWLTNHSEISIAASPRVN